MQGAWKVGLLVVTFVALFLGAFALLQRSVFAQRTIEYKARFADAGGITVGSRVLLSGVQVGQVSGIKLDGQTALVSLAINAEVKLPEGSRAVLPTSFLSIGDRQVEIILPERHVDRFLQAGATIPGSLRSPLESMMPESKETLAGLNKTLEATSKLLADEHLKGSLQKLLDTSANTAEQFGNLAGRIDGLIISNEKTVQMALRDGEKIMRDLSSVSAHLAAYIRSGKLDSSVEGLLSKLDQAVSSGNALVQDLRSVVNDPQMRSDVKEIVANTRDMTSSGTRIAANAEIISSNGIELSKKANELADKANDLADQAKVLLQRFGGTIGGLKGGPSPLGPVRTSVDLFRETSPGRWRTELGATIPAGKHNVHLGLWDAGESNKLTLELGRPLGKSGELRYGVFASKPAVGVELSLASRLNLRADVFGVNEPRFDLKARYDFNSGVSGWLGVEQIFDRNAPSIGIGVRR